MIADRSIRVKRHAATGYDVEGRPTAGTLSIVTTVKGHLFTTDANRAVDGRIVTVSEVRALLPAGTDVKTSDLLEAVDEPGVLYRIHTISSRRSPFGGVFMLSLECEAAN